MPRRGQGAREEWRDPDGSADAPRAALVLAQPRDPGAEHLVVSGWLGRARRMAMAPVPPFPPALLAPSLL